MKFDRPMQNGVPMTTQVKIETENRIPIWRLFSETGSSNVSVVD